LITLLLTIFFIEESYIPPAKAATETNRIRKNSFFTNIAQSYKLVLSDRRFLLYSLGGLLIFSLERQTSNYVAVRLGNEFSPRLFSLGNLFSFELTGIRMLSLIQLENTLLVVGFAILAAKLVNRFKLDLRLLYGGGLLYTLGYSVLGFTNSLPLILIAVMLATAGELVHVPIRQSFLAELVDRDARSSYMAINGLLFQGSKLIGALGISIGALLPSGVMAGLFLLMGLAGLLLTQLALNRQPAVCEGQSGLGKQPA
jgi:DHA1 family multidrug resistance protein B-like MFS transporter